MGKRRSAVARKARKDREFLVGALGAINSSLLLVLNKPGRRVPKKILGAVRYAQAMAADARARLRRW